MIYTSGTTGRAKGVKRDAATPEQAAAYVELLRSVYGLHPGVRALIGGPLYHSSPNAFARQALQVAELLVMQTRFDAEAALAAIERHRITHMVAVPTMFVRMLKLPEAVRRRYDLRSLQWVTHTGAPCSPETKRALMDWWGPVVYETYGGTEVGTATLSTPEDWLAFPGSVGRLTPGARMALYGEDGQPVAPGAVGEIFVRVPAYADFTYHNHPARRAEVERDGLISCGDVGYVKDDHLYLCDRRADMVISAGVNIYPAEIEAVLLQCPDVRDCAVFGIPDDEMGESLAAAVEPMPGTAPDATQLRAFLEARIARYKVRAASTSMKRCRARTAARSSSAGCAIRSGRPRDGRSDVTAAHDIGLRLAGALQRHAGLHGRVEDLRRLTGGATKTTWSFDLRTAERVHPLILQQAPARTDAGGRRCRGSTPPRTHAR